MVGIGSWKGRQSLEEVQSQFQAWRENRSRGQRIPEELWRAAASLHPQYSAYQISRALRLDHMDLKDRIGSLNKRAKGGEGAQFIELPAMGSAVGLAECMVKVRDRRGCKISIRVKGAGGVPLLEAIKGVLNGKL